MTGDLINLKLARKRQKRAADEARAKENRALYGRPLHEKKLDAAEAKRSDKALEHHRLTPPNAPSEETPDE